MPPDQLSDGTDFQLLNSVEFHLSKQAKSTVNNIHKIMNKISSGVSVTENHLSSSLILLDRTA